MTEMGRRLAAARKGQGWTLIDLAAKCGLSVAYISELESGNKVNPSLSALNALTEELGVPISHILGTQICPDGWPTTGELEPGAVAELLRYMQPISLAISAGVTPQELGRLVQSHGANNPSVGVGALLSHIRDILGGSK